MDLGPHQALGFYLVPAEDLGILGIGHSRSKWNFQRLDRLIIGDESKVELIVSAAFSSTDTELAQCDCIVELDGTTPVLRGAPPFNVRKSLPVDSPVVHSHKKYLWS